MSGGLKSSTTGMVACVRPRDGRADVDRYDPSKCILEHYGEYHNVVRFLRHWLTLIETVDGDLVDETTPIARGEAGPDNLHVWGPPVPPTFFQ